MGLKEWERDHYDGVIFKWIAACNTEQKLKRKREIKVSDDRVGKENAREKCPLI